MAAAASSDPPSRSLPGRLARCLNEGVMGFLAIVALATTTAPFVFEVTASAEHALGAVEWVIVGLFALEFALGLVTAPDRRAWLRDPWRLLDILIIAAPVVSLLPQFSDVFRSSPIIRLLRLGRVVAFGARAGGSAIRRADRRGRESQEAIRISVMRGDDDSTPAPSTWQDIIQWAAQPGPAWFHVERVERSRLPELAAASGLPVSVLDQCLGNAAWPRAERHGRFCSLFVWLPDTNPADDLDVERNGLFLLASDTGVLTLTHRHCDLQLPESALIGETRRMRRGDAPVSGVADAPFPVRLTFTLLKDVLQRNQNVLRRFEVAIRTLEDAPVHDSSSAFLRRAYKVKGEVSGLMSDLWGLNTVLECLSESPDLLQGATPAQCTMLVRFKNEATHLHGTAERLVGAVESVINLHIAVVGLEMNKFMRLLAVISIMGLFPAIVGGLLGMNIQGNPWPVTLQQVAWGVSIGMVGALYVFAVKGWLR